MPKASGSGTPRTFTFIHTADWQLGKPFAGIVDPAKRARVQQERFDAVRRIGTIVRERQARFVVVAGDLFDSPTPTHATISAALGAIADLGVPVFAIAGNHDHAGPDSVWESPFFTRERARLAPEFHVLNSGDPTVVALRDGGPPLALLPCPLRRRREADDPTAWIRDFDFSRVGDATRIVIAHGSTATFGAGGTAQRDDDDDNAAGSANAIAIERLPLDEIDYIALGDWHGFTAAGPKAWYSGTPEIDRFPKSGQEPGHVACVTAGRGAEPTVAAILTGRFRWLTHDVSLDATLGESLGAAACDAAGAGGPAHLDEWLSQATRPQAAGEPGFDGCLARIAVSGTVSLAGRAELDRIVESWQARLLRLDLADSVRIAPTRAEIHDLANRPNDPIISRVATELVRRLEAGGTGGEGGADLDAVRHALHMLHALAHPNRTVTANPGDLDAVSCAKPNTNSNTGPSAIPTTTPGATSI